MLEKPEEADIHYGPDEAPTSAEINGAQIIQGRLWVLISDISEIDMMLRFGCLQESDFKAFYSHFLALFTASRRFVPEEIMYEINPYFADRTRIRGDAYMAEMAEIGLTLALKLQDVLEANGFWQIFDPVPEPPFVGDVI
jgi:hypothetical protein